MLIIQNIKKTLALVLPCLLLATGGCMTKTHVGGYVKEADISNDIIIGQTTRDEVRERMGSPSAQSSFGNETWYYISNHKETVAFLEPEIVEQEVTRIVFNSAGTVSDVQKLTKKDGKEFDFVERSTPTEGHSMGIMEQLLGNIGRFNREPGPRTSPRPSRNPGGI